MVRALTLLSTLVAGVAADEATVGMLNRIPHFSINLERTGGSRLRK